MAQDAGQLHETGRTFMRQGDFGNASLVLVKALQLEPANLEIAKDLALNYFLAKENTKALEIIKPLLDREDADDQCFQIAGNIYKALDQLKECDKLYKKGLKKFPASGALYSEYGELLWAQQDYSAVKQWEKGIEMDANYSGNYYNATKYYYLTTDKIWSIIYGEIFLNMEPATGRTAEMKDMLLNSYKKIFSDPDILKNGKDKNEFEQAFLQTINNERNIASTIGLTPESLTMIRTRFILNWFQNYAEKFPFRLFEYDRQLLQEGIFDAYNQWIFGSAQNLVNYQNWTAVHPTEYTEFGRFQKGRIFKLPAGQYYQKK